MPSPEISVVPHSREFWKARYPCKDVQVCSTACMKIL